MITTIVLMILLLATWIWYKIDREKTIPKETQILQTVTLQPSLFEEGHPYVIEHTTQEDLQKTLRARWALRHLRIRRVDQLGFFQTQAKWTLFTTSEKAILRLIPALHRKDVMPIGKTETHRKYYQQVEPKEDAMDNTENSKVIALVLYPGMTLMLPSQWSVHTSTGTVEANFYHTAWSQLVA